MKTVWISSALALVLAACSQGTDSPSSEADEISQIDQSEITNTTETTDDEALDAEAGDAAIESLIGAATLTDVIAHERRDERRARDVWRHPMETLSFFGVEPDMTIMEVLPGNGGWYTQILNPLTADQGRLVGATYPNSLWGQMFSDWNESQYDAYGSDISKMDEYMSVEGVEPSTPIVGYTINDIPDSENGQGDAVVFFRAMHHLFRFEEPLVDAALQEVHDFLKPGGIVGVVQHRAPESADADFADGDNGYVKQSDVIAAFERNGFELVDTSEINANPADPADSFVWRLPPSATNNPETMAIGESDRMTLKFRKIEA